MKRKGNMTPQNLNNHMTRDPIDSEGNANSISRLKRMMMRSKQMCINNSINQRNMNKLMNEFNAIQRNN
jgi:hypothetical protein